MVGLEPLAESERLRAIHSHHAQLWLVILLEAAGVLHAA